MFGCLLRPDSAVGPDPGAKSKVIEVDSHKLWSRLATAGPGELPNFSSDWVVHVIILGSPLVFRIVSTVQPLSTA